VPGDEPGAPDSSAGISDHGKLHMDLKSLYREASMMARQCHRRRGNNAETLPGRASPAMRIAPACGLPLDHRKPSGLQEPGGLAAVALVAGGKAAQRLALTSKGTADVRIPWKGRRACITPASCAAFSRHLRGRQRRATPPRLDEHARASQLGFV